MASELLSFLQGRSPKKGDWSSQEIAEFYRVEAALIQAGLSLSVDRGLTDEGDPWFVFCRSIDGEVIVHFARIDSLYVIAAESVGRPISGANFREVLDHFVALHPTLIPVRKGSTSKLLLHPASLLAAVVATALFQMSSSDAIANTIESHTVSDHKQHSSVAYGHDKLVDTLEAGSIWTDRQTAAAVAAMIALAIHEYVGVDVGSGTVVPLSDATTIEHFTLSHSVVSHAPALTDLGVQLSSGSILEAAKSEIGDSHGLQTFGSIITQFWSNATAGNLGQSVSHGLLEIPNDHAAATAFAGLEFLPPVIKTPALSGGEWSFHVAEDFVTNAASGTSGAAQVANAVKTADTTAHANSFSTNTDHVGSGAPPTVDPQSQSLSQSQFTLLTDEVAASNRMIVQIYLPGSMSVQDLINFGINDVLGNEVPASVLAVVDHNIQSSLPITDPVVSTKIVPSDATDTTINTSVTTAQPIVSSVVNVPIVAPVQDATSSLKTFDATASKMLSTFMATDTYETFSTDHAIVLFDTDASHFSSPDLVRQTWSMGNGYTISIVGLLPHDVAVLA